MHQVFCSHSLLLGMCQDFQRISEQYGDFHSLEKKTFRLSLSEFQKMSETGDYYSLEELARDENLTLDPAVCGNITDEYMLVICIHPLLLVSLQSNQISMMIKIQENLTLKSANCRNINDECMVVIEMFTKFCLKNSSPPILIFSMLLGQHFVCLFVLSPTLK